MNDFIDRLDPANDDGQPRRSRGKGRKGLNIPSRPAHQPRGAGRKPSTRNDKEDTMDQQGNNELAGSLPIDPLPKGEDVSEDEKNILDDIMGSVEPEPESESEEAPASPSAVDVFVEWMVLTMPSVLMENPKMKEISEKTKEVDLPQEDRLGIGGTASMEYYIPAQNQIIEDLKAGVISLDGAKLAICKVMVEASQIGLNAILKMVAERPPQTVEIQIMEPSITPAPLEQEKATAAKAVEEAAKPVTKVYGGSALSVEITNPGKPIDPATKPLYERVMLVEAAGAQYWRPKFSRPLLPSDVIDARVIDLITGDARRQALFQLTPVLTICLPCQIEGDGGYWSADVKASEDGVIITLKNPNEELAA